MPWVESMSTATFMMIVVFAALFGLWGCVKIFSSVLLRLEGKVREANKAADKN